MKTKKKNKGISLKERQRRIYQAGDPVLYLDGRGGTFRMEKKSKTAYKIY